MTTTTKGLSASQVARRYEISRQTAHYFMQKVREAMKSSESHKMNDSVQVDEFSIDQYLAEYSFRINRSQSKDTIFNKLIKRIVECSPVSQSQLVCS